MNNQQDSDQAQHNEDTFTGPPPKPTLRERLKSYLPSTRTWRHIGTVTLFGMLATIITLQVVSLLDDNADVKSVNQKVGDLIVKEEAQTSKIGELSNGVSTMNGTLGGLSTNVGDLSTNVGGLSTNVGDLSTNVGGLSTNVGDLSTTLTNKKLVGKNDLIAQTKKLNVIMRRTRKTVDNNLKKTRESINKNARVIAGMSANLKRVLAESKASKTRVSKTRVNVRVIRQRRRRSVKIRVSSTKMRR